MELEAGPVAEPEIPRSLLPEPALLPVWLPANATCKAADDSSRVLTVHTYTQVEFLVHIVCIWRVN